MPALGVTVATAYSNCQARTSLPCESASTGALVSIVIPMRNEERFIGKCLDSILACDFSSQQSEILVVDGCSTDNSCMIVEQKASKDPRIRLLHNPQQTTPFGLNIGIKQARGHYVIRMDAHAEYPSDYVRNCVCELERTGADNVGGTLITKPGADTMVAHGIALMTQTRAGVGNSAYRIGAAGGYVDTVPFGAFRRSVFSEVGLFREDLDRSQDFEMNARIRHAGGRIYLSPIIQGTYYNAPTFSRFIRQAWQNGMWVGRTWLRYPITFCWRHAAPLMLVTLLGLPLLLSASLRPCAWISALVLCLYLLVISAASLRIALTGRWRIAAIVPSLMCSYHCTYGVSTIVGLLSSGRREYAHRPPATLRIDGRSGER